MTYKHNYQHKKENLKRREMGLGHFLWYQIFCSKKILEHKIWDLLPNRLLWLPKCCQNVAEKIWDLKFSQNLKFYGIKFGIWPIPNFSKCSKFSWNEPANADFPAVRLLKFVLTRLPRTVPRHVCVCVYMRRGILQKHFGNSAPIEIFPIRAVFRGPPTKILCLKIWGFKKFGIPKIWYHKNWPKGRDVRNRISDFNRISIEFQISRCVRGVLRASQSNFNRISVEFHPPNSIFPVKFLGAKELAKFQKKSNFNRISDF
jgi:hypothetical protein